MTQLAERKTDPQTFSRTSVSVSAAYDADDGRTRWEVAGDDPLHIELYELRYVGAPFDRDMSHRVLSLMVTREQANELRQALNEALGEERS
jgi:hypothetical protein